MVTWAADLLLLLPFLVITIIIGRPLDDTQCSAVKEQGTFEITAPEGSPFGKIEFASDGRAACMKLMAVWGFLIALCVLFAVSALSVGFLDMGERQLNKAIFAVRDDPTGGVGMGGGGYGYGYEQGMSEAGRRGFTPTPRAQPGPAEGYGMDGYDDERGMGGGVGRGYGEPPGMPPAARMPMRSNDEF